MVLKEDASGSMTTKIPNVETKPFALIVDDSITTCKIHAAVANILGYQPKMVENGKIAVDLFRSGAHFDLVLMDMMMPVMNGLEAITELRRIGVKSKIVGVTASANESDLRAFIEAGADACIIKPLDPESLAAVLAVNN